ncbi:MAG: PadR family transcriptional regulator [Bacillota bacterium]|nr:PadR family transcriptional regulator [Bacillota bacterium]
MSLEYTLLGLLNRKARTGYELSKIVAKTTNFYWTATRTQVYQSLKRMAAKDWIEVETVPQIGKPSKQVYHINENGEQAFEDWLLKPPDAPILKEPFLLHMYFLDLLPKEEIIKKIKAMQASHIKQLKEYEEYENTIIDPRRTEKENMARSLPLLNGILLEKTSLQWCEEALRKIETLEE